MRPFRALRAAFLAASLAAAASGQELVTRLDERVTGQQTLTVAAPNAASVGVALDGFEISRAKPEQGRSDFRVDFGSAPFPHTLVLTAYGERNQVLGVARHRINAGGRSAYVEILAPYARSDPASGTLALVCAHLPPDASIAGATLSCGERTASLLAVDDARCDGVALAAVVPTEETPYLSARVTLQDGEMLEDTIPLDSYLGFGEELTVRLSRYLVRPVDRDGSTVSGIAENLFQVREDRKELPIKAVASVADAPLDIAIVLDASQSTFGDTAMEQVFVDAVLALLKPDRDRAIVYAISTTPRPLLPDWTSDHARIEKALRTAMRLTPGLTSAYDTLEEVIGRFQSTGGTNLSAGAILYMTDGADSMVARQGERADARRRDEILAYARASGIQVHPIVVSLPVPAHESQCTASARNGLNPAYLDALAQLTGGERTLVTLDANPAPFLREAERYAMEIHKLQQLKTEDAAKTAQKKIACKKFMLKEYERQAALSTDERLSERIRNAIAAAGVSLRTQYVLEVETIADRRPRERRLEFFVQHPLVQAVRAPNATYY